MFYQKTDYYTGKYFRIKLQSQIRYFEIFNIIWGGIWKMLHIHKIIFHFRNSKNRLNPPVTCYFIKILILKRKKYYAFNPITNYLNRTVSALNIIIWHHHWTIIIFSRIFFYGALKCLLFRTCKFFKWGSKFRGTNYLNPLYHPLLENLTNRWTRYGWNVLPLICLPPASAA